MSGGVDSSVAALLLKKKGYIVEGATFSISNFKKNDEIDLNDAKKVCTRLGINHHILDFNDIFDKLVIQPFCKNYLLGNTPNPCITCNEFIKFGAFFNIAKKLGFENIATGHYAINNDGILYQSTNEIKDQSYFLYRIDKSKLKNIFFPLGNLSKDKIRKIALENDLCVYNKSDSQEICFIDDKYKSFLRDKFKSSTNCLGNFIDENGNILGKHNGIYNYTIGQRKGLNISLGKRMFVSKIDNLSYDVTLSDEDKLYKDKLSVSDLNLLLETIEFKEIIKNNLIDVKIRSGISQNKAKLSFNGDIIDAEFTFPIRAITRGQSAVFYLNKRLLGGGVIK